MKLKQIPYLLIGLAVVGLLAARIVLASDFPQLGDKFALAYASKEFPADGMIVGINTKSLRQEEDGTRSIVYYMRAGTALQFKIKDAVAVGMGGRIAIRCNSNQYRFYEQHILDSQNNTLAINKGTDWTAINDEDEATKNIEAFVCNTDLPSLTKGATKL